MTITASAPGKAILLGEHVAAYGKPVLAVTIDLRAYVTVSKRKDKKVVINAPDLDIKDYTMDLSSDYLDYREASSMLLVSETIRKTQEYIRDSSGLDIFIRSEIPLESGLGSSASIIAATILAIATESKFKLEKREIADLAWQCEHMIHSKSSGVDPFTVTFGGLCLYKKGEVASLKVPELPPIVIAHSGIKSITRGIVEDVDKMKKNDPEIFEDLLNLAENIVLTGKEAVENENWVRLGSLMSINHGLLSSIGVSCIQLERLVYASRIAGALGSKLCGAGRGGVIVALVSEEGRENVRKSLVKVGGKLINTQPTEIGVKIEER
ncbi:MAG: mevalonate kinase [Candidatus Altiarchaeota archaeon]|nr:mevalonate kinase [Candidatus Altiarchaeota archaeon]